MIKAKYSLLSTHIHWACICCYVYLRQDEMIIEQFRKKKSKCFKLYEQHIHLRQRFSEFLFVTVVTLPHFLLQKFTYWSTFVNQTTSKMLKLWHTISAFVVFPAQLSPRLSRQSRLKWSSTLILLNVCRRSQANNVMSKGHTSCWFLWEWWGIFIKF